MDNTTSSQQLSFIPPLAYDAVSLITLALNETITNNETFIDDCISGSNDHCVLNANLWDLDFSGNSVRSYYDIIIMCNLFIALFQGSSTI